MAVDSDKLKKLIADFSASGGSEMANAQLFVERLTGALGVEQPSPAKEETRLNDYVFERAVTFNHPNGSTSTGRIDCYNRGRFILEAKQSAKRKKARATKQLELAGVETKQKPGTAKRGTRGWDQVMIAARNQAENYARALPRDHDYPPFLLIVDVGNVIEVFADFSGQGRNYAHFPDRQSYRLSMGDLRDDKVQERLTAIWQDPHSLDPAKISAKVTEDIARRLAKIAKSLERKHDPKDIAEFLMRCLFTMFAEDVGLIEKTEAEKDSKTGPFENLLQSMIDTPEHFPMALEDLWRTMDQGGYAAGLNRALKRFNGSLFKSRRALPLDEDDIRELWLAAKRDWRDVEPAIFGTLLERALNSKERSQLGAHFTPRVYVERLIVPTIIEPLREDWEEVQARVEDLKRQGKHDDAVAAVRNFHHRLCTTRVLDPACGTGNFLYVALELMKRLEGEILETLEALGDDEARLLLDGETVGPRQFYGLEINPRAVPIADLVLWIGFLKWQLRTVEVKDLPEPILHAYGTIREQDAILAYDKQELLRNEDGTPMTRWDGETTTLHPITGEDIPDPDAQMELYRYENPRRADWPEAEFIVGNPPFIGGKDMRAELGDGYAEAAWKARKGVPGGADFVMHFWDEAATRLLAKPPAKSKGENPLRRFGFITTNSITQTFSRRVVEKHMNAKLPLSLAYAVPDHPWVKGSERAAVRIAMTVAVRGERQGKLAEVVHESGLNSDTPDVRLESEEGKITSKLRIGADLSRLNSNLAYQEIAHMGVKLHGKGFVVSSRFRSALPKLQQSRAKKFLNGKDLAQHSRGAFVIDVCDLSRESVRADFGELYQHLLENVKPVREAQADNSPTADAISYAKTWWVWGKPRFEWREAISNLPRYFGTSRTAKHRLFVSLSEDQVIESKVVGLALPHFSQFCVLSSRLHIHFANETGGWQGVGNDPVYQHSATFNQFTFPILTDAQAAKLDALGERLDAFRKERLAEHDFLTMTDMYNVLERLRELDAGAEVEPLSDKEKDIHEAGLISVLKDIHDEIDRDVFAAYGWEDLGKRLVGKPGATTPSPHKSDDQEEAEEELLTRLVALNQERAAEEKRGLVRWLRPDYQIPRLGYKVPEAAEQQEAELIEVGIAEQAKWPADGLAQIRIVRDVLDGADAPMSPEILTAAFTGRRTKKRVERVLEVLETLVATGAARTTDNGDGYFVTR